MKKRFLSLGLRKKIQFLFLCTMIVCILFCSGIFYLILENQMQQSIADKERVILLLAHEMLSRRSTTF